MSDKMREDFELWAGGRSMPLLRSGEGYAAERTGMAWKCWKASRESVVIEPPKALYSQGTSDEYKRGSRAVLDAYHHRLLDQGLKVRK